MNKCTWSMMAVGMPWMMWNKMMECGMSAASMRRACTRTSEQSRSCVTSSTASSASASARKSTTDKNIVELASESGMFTRLISALEAAHLVDTLKSAGPFTVFAPSDEAFAGLPQEALAEILKDTEKLASILTFHVVPGRFTSDMLTGVDSLKTVQGTPLKIDTTLGVKAGSAHVIKADIAVSNGVIHVVDSVLMPE